jgi:DNA-binding transcriptional LysR family regulator
MRLSIKALQYFLIACEQKSIVNAAKILNVVPSAVSVAIDNVEQEFALKLVQRYPAKGLGPTAAGIQLMKKIRLLIEEYNNLISEGVELRTALSGNLSVGYYAPVAPAFMPAIIGPLIKQNPDVKLKFTECDNEQVQAGLLGGKYDCIVFVAENVRNGIEYETLIEVPPYLLVSAEHPLADRQKIDISELHDLPLVLLDLPFTSEFYRSMIEQHSVEANIVATASTTEMVRSLVGAGIGCSILNMRPIISKSYAGNELKAIPFSTPLRPLKLVLGHMGGNERRLVEVFRTACNDYFSSPSIEWLIVKDDITK